MMTKYICTDIYPVQAGDTLYSIAQQYDVDVELLMRANHLDNPYNLQIGARLCIPGPADADAGGVETAAAMDSAGDAADRIGTAADRDIRTEHDAVSENSHPAGKTKASAAGQAEAPAPAGQRTAGGRENTAPEDAAPAWQRSRLGGRRPEIPDADQPEMPPGCRAIHTIEAGDTLYLIARTYGVTLDALIAANPALDPYNLRIGSRLCIPA